VCPYAGGVVGGYKRAWAKGGAAGPFVLGELGALDDLVLQVAIQLGEVGAVASYTHDQVSLLLRALLGSAQGGTRHRGSRQPDRLAVLRIEAAKKGQLRYPRHIVQGGITPTGAPVVPGPEATSAGPILGRFQQVTSVASGSSMCAGPCAPLKFPLCWPVPHLARPSGSCKLPHLVVKSGTMQAVRTQPPAARGDRICARTASSVDRGSSNGRTRDFGSLY
jgi:hypothetical protein